MSFLLDTDIASAFLKNHPRVASRVMMHYGSLHLSVVTVGELLAWARRVKAPPGRLQGVLDRISVCEVHDVDYAAAETFGRIRATCSTGVEQSGPQTSSTPRWPWFTT